MSPSLAYLIISSPALAGVRPPSSDGNGDADGDEWDEDQAEAAQIVLYAQGSPGLPMPSRDTMLRHLGLAQGLDHFASMFAPSSPATHIGSSRSTLVTVSPEPGFFLHVNITLKSRASSTAPSSSSGARSSASQPGHRPPPELVEAVLLHAYARFRLLHGPFQTILDRAGRKALDDAARMYWKGWAALWGEELECGSQGAAVSVERLLGGRLPPISYAHEDSDDPPPHAEPASDPSSTESAGVTAPPSFPPTSTLLSHTAIYQLTPSHGLPPDLLHYLLTLLPDPTPGPSSSSAASSRETSSQRLAGSHSSGRTVSDSSTIGGVGGWLNSTSLGIGGLGTWVGGGDSSRATAPRRGASPGPSPMDRISSSAAGTTRKWYSGAGLVDFFTPSASSTASSDTCGGAAAPSTALCDLPVVTETHFTAESTPISSLVPPAPSPSDLPASSSSTLSSSSALPPPDANLESLTSLREAMASTLPSPEPRALAWSEHEVWLAPAEGSGEEKKTWEKRVVKHALVHCPTPTMTPPTLFAFLSPLDTSTTTPLPLPTEACLFSLLPLPNSTLSTNLPPYLLLTTPSARATPAWDARISPSSSSSSAGQAAAPLKGRDAEERSFLRSLALLRSDPSIKETVARSGLLSKWTVARRANNGGGGERGDAAALLVVEGKGVSFGEVDSESLLDVALAGGGAAERLQFSTARIKSLVRRHKAFA